LDDPYLKGLALHSDCVAYSGSLFFLILRTSTNVSAVVIEITEPYRISRINEIGI
jgi:hypothetical protein